ncbi:hypothetical protein TNCT_451401 [Trichonephila clavata]|uniref:BTB domain-containing protein n=1 Tax=Trichonephila clavata TaxID=2740835 RepID=A0A8X6I9S3_TRICU|nr:hypothetical protein TNCT_451401 [Trichonephila clavata]
MVQLYLKCRMESESSYCREEFYQNLPEVHYLSAERHGLTQCFQTVILRVLYKSTDNKWHLSGFFPLDILDENNSGYFKKDCSVSLEIEAEITLYEEFGRTPEYFSDSLTENSKKLRPSLRNDLELFGSNRKGCDVILRCENSDFPAHKSLLCCKSPVFSAMFESDMKERERERKEIWNR